MCAKKSSNPRKAPPRKPRTIQVIEDPPSDEVASTEPTKPSVTERKLSALDAAVLVLRDSGEPMNTKQMIEAMTSQGYWTSPGGKTPHATLFSAIQREIVKRGDASRFAKAERGKFVLTGHEAKA